LVDKVFELLASMIDTCVAWQQLMHRWERKHGSVEVFAESAEFWHRLVGEDG
jgi:hypothetical protein